MLHLVNQPIMKHRVHILQAKFLLRTLVLPDDTLLSRLFPYLRTSASHSQWYKLTSSPVWRKCSNQDIEQINRQQFKTICRDYLQDSYNNNCAGLNSKLLSSCRPAQVIDPILWLPMTHIERSRLIRWRLGWLHGGLPKPCIYHPSELLTRKHAIRCLHMHRRLQMPHSIADPSSFLLNQLPMLKRRSPPTQRDRYTVWFTRWPVICQILYELDYLQHEKIAPDCPILRTALVSWLSNNSSSTTSK